MTTRFQLASEKTASNIIPKNVKVYVNGSDVPLESEYGAYDPETGNMALSYMGADLKSLEIVISKSKEEQPALVWVQPKSEVSMYWLIWLKAQRMCLVLVPLLML
ncbi:MAG: hypothetical protein ACLTL6_14970 [Holdemanella porci]